MATPRALPVWTALLGLGHILPAVLVLVGAFGGLADTTLFLAVAALLVSLATRTAITLVADEPAATISLHPATVVVALAIQWNVLLRRKRAGAAVWKGRSYPAGGA